MGEDLEFEGEDLQEALARAGESMGIGPDALDYEVLQEGRRGFLGVGGRGVRIRVRSTREAGAVPNGAPAAAPGRTDGAGTAGEDARKVEAFLQEFAAAAPFEIQFRIAEQPEKIQVELEGKDRDFFLARRGEGLNALQVVLGRVAAQKGSARAVFLDCGDFRRGREEELAEIALLMAEKVKKLGEPQSLSPMNPYDRRLVHLALKDDPLVETRSDGDGFLKSITIYPRRS